MIAMLGTFIDTLVMCSMTGLVIVIMDVWPRGISAARLAASAFASGLIKQTLIRRVIQRKMR